jgi:hypothetical protein
MSDAEEKKRDETKADETAKTRKEERKDPQKPAAEKSKYVFKIVPADPKNSFDFEDVADK